MGSTQQPDDPDTSTVRETVLEPIRGFLEPIVDALEPVFVLLEPIRNSILLQIATVGVVLFALGPILDGTTLGPVLNEGGAGGDGELMAIWAATVTVWGVGLILVGLGLYGFIWWRRR